MARKIGGYRLIDFRNKAITTGGDAVTIPGIYDTIESCRVATVLTGLVIDGTEHRETVVNFYVDDGDFVGAFPGGKTITITNDDEVTILEEE